MKALALTAIGALALSGCDFAGTTDFVAVPVANVQLNNLPAAQADGTPWDADGAADVFVEIQNGAGRTIWRSEQLTDAQLAAPIVIPAAIEVASATTGVMVTVFDYDTSLFDSQLMARSTTFSASELSAGSELELSMRDRSGTALAGTTVTVRSAAQ